MHGTIIRNRMLRIICINAFEFSPNITFWKKIIIKIIYAYINEGVGLKIGILLFFAFIHDVKFVS